MKYRLRAFGSKRFLVSWVVVFAALIGVLSGLVQLIPALKISITISVLLILLSAAIGAGYALLTNQSEHLPIVDLMPEEPVLGPSMSIECSTNRDVIVQVNNLAAEVYPGVTPLSVDRYEQWLMVNDRLLVSLFDQNREVVGYFEVFPLRSDFFDFMIAGTCGEHDIRREYILSIEQSRSTRRLYLGGLAVKHPNRMKGKRNAYYMLWGLLKYLQHYYSAPCDCDLYAEAVTPDGEKLLKRFHFRLVSPAKGRRDPYPLYVVSLSDETFKLVLASIPDWSTICQLGWEQNSLPANIK